MRGTWQQFLSGFCAFVVTVVALAIASAGFFFIVADIRDRLREPPAAQAHQDLSR